MGLKKAQDLYGVASRVVLTIDNSEEANEVYQKTFPGVAVVQHKLGVAFADTRKVIAKYGPESEWKSMYWHCSPSCVEGSTVNILQRNMTECCRLTKWIIVLFNNLHVCQSICFAKKKAYKQPHRSAIRLWRTA